MSDKILKALMQLFAIVANSGHFTDHSRRIVEAFLKQQLSLAYVETYLTIFDEHLKNLTGKTDKGKEKKRVSVNSVKVLRICTDINAELSQKQKYIVLIRLIEFAFAGDQHITEQENEFLSTVANVFNIHSVDYNVCVWFASCKSAADIKDSPLFLLINNHHENRFQYSKHLRNESLPGDLWVLNLKSEGILFVKHFGSHKLTLNGLPIHEDAASVLSPGSVIRGLNINPVYYTDIMRCYMEDITHSDIELQAKNIEYVFSNGKKGLNDISFKASSGNLIGIMGGSGAGKSTLLNILNGNYTPSKGSVLINGINIHTERKKTEGIIGFVPQDDLLMEDLTVFQNLFYNSKLCFGNLSDAEIENKVINLLHALGLFETRDLKVGDALSKTISGGQRKRLNIALELIRTPSVLFVDEPTSGLSSLDSENVMDLLKQLAISGNLVFVVIHQPSSDIFKLFDKLLILDIGGYQIYYGNPADSIIYFKRKASYADADEGECITCGNINPEQVFSIIESKMVDEFGNTTDKRKITPDEWNAFYNESSKDNTGEEQRTKSEVPVLFIKPSWLKQTGVFIFRDLLSKLRNKQYLLINFLEAPLLAFILGYFLKYYKEGHDYIFRENLNLPAFIFMGVIVALFMGLTVSAEEIIRDRKILKRESFLNLSRSSYLFSKTVVQFFISAIQTFSYAFIACYIFEIKGMLLEYWLILFSVSCFANLMGLNISSAFDSAVTIYILVPLLIIPQIILSGVMVKFQDLDPAVTSQDKVPIIGELMVSRWAFEALSVNQYKNNEYEKHFFDHDKIMSNATHKKDFWLVKMIDKLDLLKLEKDSDRAKSSLELLKNELKKIPQHEIPVDVNSISDSDYDVLKNYFDKLRRQEINKYNKASSGRDSISKALISRFGEKKLSKLKDDYTNESLNDLVLNANDFNVIVEDHNELIQHYHPVYMEGSLNTFIRAPFYVSSKNMLGKQYDTYKVNLAVIWLMSALLALTLYFNILRKIVNRFGN